MGYKAATHHREPISGLHVQDDIQDGEHSISSLSARNASRQDGLNSANRNDWPEQNSLTDRERTVLDGVNGGNYPRPATNRNAIGAPKSLETAQPRGYSEAHPEVGDPSLGNALSRLPKPKDYVSGSGEHYGKHDEPPAKKGGAVNKDKLAQSAPGFKPANVSRG